MTDEVTEEAPKTFTEDQVKAMLDEHTSGLKSKVEELLGESKAAKAKAREAQEIAQRETEQAAKKTGNIEALEKSWTEKYTARESELTGSLTEKDGIIARLTAGATAKDIASQLALKGSERVLEKIVSERLGVEIVEGQPKVIVKDAAGQRSALTMDDLKKEILSDTALKPILQGTQGSGAGGVGQSGGAGAGNTIAASELEKMTPAQKAAYFKQHPGVSVQT
jgi:hypothetical protein